jgi:hypothetical protein
MASEFDIPTPPPESRETSDESLELTVHGVAELVEQLDFRPSPELIEASRAVIAGLRDEMTTELQLSLAWGEYARMSEGIIEEDLDPKRYARGQIGALIHKALLFRAADITVRYLEELDHAEVYALNVGLDDVSAVLTREIDRKLPELEMSSEVLVLKLRGIISDENREVLRDLINDGDDYEDIVNNAYNMIEDENRDADEVLAALGVLE